MISRKTPDTTPETGTVNCHYAGAGGVLYNGDKQGVCQNTDARSITTLQFTTNNDLVAVLIVDTKLIIREGLKSILAGEQAFGIVGEAVTGGEAIDICFASCPQLVIMDLSLPDMDGHDVIYRVRRHSSAIRIVAFASVVSDEEIHRSIEAGVSGILFQDAAREELLKAVRTVCAGHRFIGNHVAKRIAQYLPRISLTCREVAILELIAAGSKNKEIAANLFVSEATINAHVRHILDKLQASDRTHAVVTALQRGLIHLDGLANVVPHEIVFDD